MLLGNEFQKVVDLYEYELPWKRLRGRLISMPLYLFSCPEEMFQLLSLGGELVSILCLAKHVDDNVVKSFSLPRSLPFGWTPRLQLFTSWKYGVVSK